MLKNRLFVIVLLFSIVPTLFVVQAFSQSYTTVTTKMTTSNYVSTTNTQTTPVSSYATTNTIKTTIADSWTQSAVDARHCLVEYYPINLDAGQALIGTIKADQKDSIVLYLLSEQQVNTWKAASPRYCNPEENQVSPIWYSGTVDTHVTEATLKYTAAGAGLYYLVVETYYYKPVGISVNLATQFGETTTVVLYQTVFSTAVYSFTQTMTSELIEQLSAQATSNLGSGSMLLVIILVVAVLGALIVVLAVRSSRRRSGPPATPRAQIDTSKRFCISCGAELPLQAKFCNKCGSTQN
jgi:hypothetical protein